jgi:cytoskeletal protein CcmA (bactofilin family)
VSKKTSLFKAGELNGFLGRGTTCMGDLVFEDSMRIDGSFQGTIRSESVLFIGETADIEADIDVGVLLVSGKVVGKIRATDRVEIQPGGKVIGDIRAPNLITRSGAIFRGNCFIGEEEELTSQPFKTERAFFKGAS